jgi:hypothetical protein
MDESTRRRTKQLSIFGLVVGLHGGVVALAVMSSRLPSVALPATFVELMAILPDKRPPVRTMVTRPPRLATNIAVALSPTPLNISPSSGPAGDIDTRGTAVDWTAEAHRAIRALEIRRDQQPSSAMSVSYSAGEWWRNHHAGDQSRTPAGDWIVWIDDHCYLIASWSAKASSPGPEQPEPMCEADSTTARAQ